MSIKLNLVLGVHIDIDCRESWCKNDLATMLANPFKRFKDYSVDDFLDSYGIHQHFLFNSGADVTVTNRKDLINDLQHFSNLILTDSGGHDHISEGIGHINPAEQTLPCHYAPSLKVSVISTKT